jgi:hypothetical protein
MVAGVCVEQLKNGLTLRPLGIKRFGGDGGGDLRKEGDL